MKNTPTKIQQDILRDVLTNFIGREVDQIRLAHMVGWGRAEVVERKTRVLNVSIILEDVLGVEGAKEETSSRLGDV